MFDCVFEECEECKKKGLQYHCTCSTNNLCDFCSYHITYVITATSLYAQKQTNPRSLKNIMRITA